MINCKCGTLLNDNWQVCPRCGYEFNKVEFKPNNLAKCPECGNYSIIYQEGCAYCTSCNRSKFEHESSTAVESERCPECGNYGTIIYQEGCAFCTVCAWSRCG